MQTFLPYRSFSDSAAVLDQLRLSNQIKECKQIYDALTVPGYGWQHHPALRMWRGHEFELLLYGYAMYKEWKRRKPQPFTSTHKSGELIATLLDTMIPFRNASNPQWLGNAEFHASHRAALLYKLPAYYSRFGWKESPAVPDAKGKLPYVWPVGG